jgi:tetratricopeptide (TPR) repeat protein
VLAITCASALANAQPASEADTHLERGKHLYEAQDYDGAIAEYQAGYVISPRAEFLYGIGQAYRMKGDCERAARAYNEVVRAPDGAKLADAARRNIERCHPGEPQQQTPPPNPPPQTPPKPIPPPPKPRPAPAVSVETAPWYRDALGDALVLGGAALVAGGTISWKVGRNEAENTYGKTTYQAWATSSQQASHADTLQRVGIAAATVGGAAVIAGVIRYVWPSQRAVDATPAGVSVAF